ncbi:GNAT family N-acetyltransferase [Limosilactobacillus equigenerosi]|uniref:Acetyltransferase n=1 Tax=Limosilactobacillus equigenerosi DSM 18793 = JCM 14505 TaxID=1423742 RepID=A0A0R1UL48_9LACO|nr:GNAT family N-acetyltransferase [Limosilactobacillus equigenerosi]KRL93961.1 acetyltransferase [Limosilactobacillus equigenerosi DSM 18793 = JCM 14505]MCQ2570186.1 GNAT family N-acetyltransferase [Limosilactobacillus sp.]
MSVKYLRPAVYEDVAAIMQIINDAKALLKADGSTQWQSGTPNQQMIEDDIQSGIGKVLIVDGVIAGYAVLDTEIDKFYHTIYEGEWAKPHERYTTIHRFAISKDFRGQNLSSVMFEHLITASLQEGIYNVRFDTFKMNKRLQHLGDKFGFVHRGNIQTADPVDPWRFAYELNL